MAKAKTVAAWMETSQTYMSDGPPKLTHHKAYMFVNRCEVRETPRGVYLQRKLDVEEIRAGSKEELERKVGDFLLRDDVRLLVKGLETNDFHTLPRRALKVSPAILTGTADIYTPKDSIGKLPEGDE